MMFHPWWEMTRGLWHSSNAIIKLPLIVNWDGIPREKHTLISVSCQTFEKYEGNGSSKDSGTECLCGVLMDALEKTK